MATSIKRVIIITLIMNLLFGIIMIFAGNIQASNNDLENEMNNFNEYQGNFTNSFNTEFSDTTPDTNTIQFNNNYGNVRAGQKNIVSILMGGVGNGIKYVLQDECVDARCNRTFESWIKYGILLVWGLLNTFMILDIVFITYSRKWD